MDAGVKMAFWDEGMEGRESQSGFSWTGFTVYLQGGA